MQVMRPGADKSQLKVIYQDQMVVGELEDIMRETTCNGFPVVVSPTDMFVVGYVTRRDLQLALNNARKSYQYVTTNSKVYFTNNVPDFEPNGSSPAPLMLKKVMDLVSVFHFLGFKLDWISKLVR